MEALSLLEWRQTKCKIPKGLMEWQHNGEAYALQWCDNDGIVLSLAKYLARDSVYQKFAMSVINHLPNKIFQIKFYEKNTTFQKVLLSELAKSSGTYFIV